MNVSQTELNQETDAQKKVLAQLINVFPLLPLESLNTAKRWFKNHPGISWTTLAALLESGEVKIENGILHDILPDIDALVSQMRGPLGLKIQDRRYRLKLYPQCFIGSEAVNWLAEKQNTTKEKAVWLGQIIVNRGIIHHVLDEHHFEDGYFFYRFYEDDVAKRWFKNHPGISWTTLAALLESGDVKLENGSFHDILPEIDTLVGQMRGPLGLEIKDRRYNRKLYHKCFIGSAAVNWLMETKNLTEDQAVWLGQIIVNRGIIHHVLDEHHFEDGYFFYRFYEDDSKLPVS